MGLRGREFQPEDRIDRYLIVREIGRGGMGTIYLARDTMLRRMVALKVLANEAAGARSTRERFVREAQAAAKIRHPNVVAVYDVNVGTPPYIVLEYLLGETFDAIFKREGALPFERALELFLPVMSAVAAAHEAGVVHRDLKPSNVMLAQERDGASTPKVLDFGISKVTRVTKAFRAAGAERDLDLTGEDQHIGTPGYMPPEQHGAHHEVGPWSDVYAIALMLYLAVTGARAFPGRSSPEVLLAKLRGAFKRPTAHAPELPAELDAWMTRALAPEPARRTASVRDMALSLLAFAPDPVRARWLPAFEANDATLAVSASGASAPEEEVPVAAPREPTEIPVDVSMGDASRSGTEILAPPRVEGPRRLALGLALLASAALGGALALYAQPPRASGPVAVRAGLAMPRAAPRPAQAPRVQTPPVEAPHAAVARVEAPRVEAPRVEAPPAPAVVAAPAPPRRSSRTASRGASSRICIDGRCLSRPRFAEGPR